MRHVDMFTVSLVGSRTASHAATSTPHAATSTEQVGAAGVEGKTGGNGDGGDGDDDGDGDGDGGGGGGGGCNNDADADDDDDMVLFTTRITMGSGLVNTGFRGAKDLASKFEKEPKGSRLNGSNGANGISPSGVHSAGVKHGVSLPLNTWYTLKSVV